VGHQDQAGLVGAGVQAPALALRRTGARRAGRQPLWITFALEGEKPARMSLASKPDGPASGARRRKK